MKAELADKAESYFRKGFNCAESVLLAAIDIYDLNLNPEAVRLATGLGGGLGRGDVCGALSGAVLALGAALGRIHQDQSQDAVKEVREQVVADFESEFRSLGCRDLRTEDREDCVAYVRQAAMALDQVLTQKS